MEKPENQKLFDIQNLHKIHVINEDYKIDPMIILKKEFSFACGLENGSVKIYSRKPPFEFQLELQIHSNFIVTIFESKIGELITGANDKTIKITIYDLKVKNFQIIKIISGHSGSVNKIIGLKNIFGFEILASCSMDQTIRIWNKKRGQSILIYNNETYVWDLLEISNYRIIYCYNSGGLFVIHYKKGNIEKVKDDIECCGTNGLCKIQKKNLIAISGINSIYLIDNNNYEIKKTILIKEHFYFWCSCLLSDGSLISSGNNINIYHFNIEEGKLIKSKNIHDGNIPTILEIEDKILVTSSYDKTIQFFKL